MAYLLGEMDTDHVVQFELRLTDPEVAQALLQESQLLCELAVRDTWPALDPPAQTTAPDASPCPAPQASTDSASPRPLRTLSVLFTAIAATLLVGFLVPRGQPESQSVGLPETEAQWVGLPFEVAQALVDPAIEWTPAWGPQNEAAWAEEMPASFANDLETSDDDPDDALGWMVVAVKAAQLQEADNDG